LQAAAGVFFGHAHHQPQVSLDQQVLGLAAGGFSPSHFGQDPAYGFVVDVVVFQAAGAIGTPLFLAGGDHRLAGGQAFFLAPQFFGDRV